MKRLLESADRAECSNMSTAISLMLWLILTAVYLPCTSIAADDDDSDVQRIEEIRERARVLIANLGNEKFSVRNSLSVSGRSN